ncbi:MAG: DUF3299 domain-containing protein [Hyphomicrobiaceae bacterium]|nr:DUF3299 domain-containing protein [Hyphomicrobiaceae bacterium]
MKIGFDRTSPPQRPRLLRIIVLGLVALAAPALAREAPRELRWADLRPPPPPEDPTKAKLKPFWSKGASGTVEIRGVDTSEPAPPPTPEGKWMSRTTAQKSAAPAPVIAALDGQRIRLGGYVVPLDFQAAKVTEFLLVPFVGACIHVPPPPANQIVYVKTSEPFAIKGEFDPVYVTGTMKTATTFTGLAETGYALDADLVEVRNE